MLFTAEALPAPPPDPKVRSADDGVQRPNDCRDERSVGNGLTVEKKRREREKENKEGESTLSPVYTATEYEPVNPGLYTAKLAETKEASGERGPYYRWKFVIEDEGEFKGREVYANVSDKFGPKSKARQWAEQMIGRPIKKGERFDTDVLLGKSYHIMVGNTKEDERGRAYDYVENVHRLRPQEQDAERSKAEPEGPDEDDFGHIPL